MKNTLLLVASLCALGGQLAAAQTKPNILFIVGDDMGYADVGFHGCKDIPTPNLDALAKSGVRFTSGYVSGPYCSPTRAALLTGRYQNRFGHEFNPSGSQGMPLTETTIAQRLKAAGYATGLVGKWHLGTEPAMRPPQRGFDEFFGFLGGAHSYVNATGVLRGDEQVKELDYTTDAFGREAVAFIEQHRAEPWFLYLAFNAVHTPMEATDDRLAKFPNIADTQTGGRNQGVTAARLYHLVSDPGETKDLAAAMPDKLKALQSQWEAWNTANVKPLWGGGNSSGVGNEPGAAKGRKNARTQP